MDILWKGQSARIREMGNGAPLVLVHGYPLDGAMWSGVARALSPKFRVIKPDLPGRGDTVAPSSGSLEDYADFLETILNALETPAGLAGFSMGGYARSRSPGGGPSGSPRWPSWTRARSRMTRPAARSGTKPSRRCAPGA